MLRHNHITEQCKVVAVANLVKSFQEDIASLLESEERQSSVATKSDEVQVPLAVSPLQPVFLGRRKHAPLYLKGRGTLTG